MSGASIYERLPWSDPAGASCGFEHLLLPTPLGGGGEHGAQVWDITAQGETPQCQVGCVGRDQQGTDSAGKQGRSDLGF